MVWIIFIGFVAVPAIEIALFIEIGGWLGLWPTLAVVFLTAALGTILLRQQGMEVLRRAQQSMDAGEAPVREAFDGLCLFFAGGLLLTPGFFTDAVGFLLFFPPFRGLLLGLVAARVITAANANGPHGAGPGHNPQGFPRRPGQRPDGGPIIDGEYAEVPDEPAGHLDNDAKPPSDNKPT